MNEAVEVPVTSVAVNVASATLHRASAGKRTALVALAVAAYAAVLPWCFSTMGRPLERALEENRRLAENRTLLEESVFRETAAEDSVAAWGGDDGDGDGDGDVREDAVAGKAAGGSKRAAAVAPPPDAADARVGAASANTTNTTAPERPLPSEFLPDVLPLLALLLTVGSHVLFHLGCRWSVAFHAATLFEPDTSGVAAGRTVVYVRPREHRGKEALCVVEHNDLSKALCVVFQRQTY